MSVDVRCDVCETPMSRDAHDRRQSFSSVIRIERNKADVRCLPFTFNTSPNDICNGCLAASLVGRRVGVPLPQNPGGTK